MPLPAVEKIEVPRPVHVVPLVEYAMVFVPAPTATQREPVQHTPLPCVEKTVEPIAVHTNPRATHLESWKNEIRLIRLIRTTSHSQV
jgi:hypothetical protein